MADRTADRFPARPVIDTDSADLARFHAAPDLQARELGWARLVERYTPLVLKVARGLGGGHDAALDRYAYVLERLRDDDFRRLRIFRPDGLARFSTWLVVIARRLCLDHYRIQFGRAPARPDADHGLRRIRRRLVTNNGDAVDLAAIPDAGAVEPAEALDGNDRAAVLTRLLSGLSPRDRLLLQLRFHDDLTALEIARTMEFPTPFHVYRRVQSVLGQLRTSIENHPLFRRDRDA